MKAEKDGEISECSGKVFWIYGKDFAEIFREARSIVWSYGG